MTLRDLNRVADDAMVKTLSATLKASINRLRAAGHGRHQILAAVRRGGAKRTDLVYLAVEAYLDRGEVMPKAAQTLAARVRRLREKAGLSAYALAKQAGLEYARYYRIESGEHPDPRCSAVKAIAAALGVTTDALLAG